MITADIQKFRERYVAEWRQNAIAHEKNGDYGWMSSFLHGYEKVLEIGPGDGKGTLQLTRDGHTVVGVDENPACLRETEALLRSHTVATQMELRGDIRLASRAQVEIQYKPIAATIIPGTVTLLEGDPLKDPALGRWLADNAPFDAIACWNIGTYALRLAGIDGRKYRLMVQNKIYDLADRILRPGGILHIVDRAPNVEKQREDTFVLHREQAETTSLIPEQFDRRSIDDGPVEGGIPLRSTISGDRKIPEGVGMSLVSMIVRRPVV